MKGILFIFRDSTFIKENHDSAQSEFTIDYILHVQHLSKLEDSNTIKAPVAFTQGHMPKLTHIWFKKRIEIHSLADKKVFASLEK